MTLPTLGRGKIIKVRGKRTSNNVEGLLRATLNNPRHVETTRITEAIV